MASVPPNIYTMSEVCKHCDQQSCWLVINDEVYDVTKFVEKHPGGPEIIFEYGGSDATDAFTGKGHSQYAYYMLSDYRIGQLAETENV
ncbi:uncharacterized protein [Ptychodera flava]|uniref:uncharacterized protein n=1 Tax=Ptychodera flava TaxID=63121 RepID=UPI00396A41A7